MRRLVLLALTLACLVEPAAALAHPLGNTTVNATAASSSQATASTSCTRKGAVKNRDLWERLFALVEDDARDVSFVWLKRATEANNNIVDRLSREASKSHAEN